MMSPPRPARRRRGTLSDEDRSIWASFVQVVTRLHGQPPPPAPPPVPQAVAPAATIVPAPARPAPKVPPRPVAVGIAPGGLDRATWQKLRGGKLTPERTLDLHGRTAERAHHALRAFLHHAQAEQLRCVEVITGRGVGEVGGVLRRELPEWLNAPDLRPLILAVTHPHARNLGAVRILLRRRR